MCWACSLMKSTSIKSKNNVCPDSFSLELECVKRIQSSQEKSPNQHLETCESCREDVKVFNDFYLLFSQQVRRPVSTRFLDFIRARSSQDIQGGIIICSRQPQADQNSALAYTTKLVFLTSRSNGNKALANFDLSAIKQNQIVFRVLKFHNNQACLFLWAANGLKLDKQTVQIGNSRDRIKMNQAGTALIPCSSIEELDKKIVYFSENGKSPASNICEKIVNSILF